LSHCRLAISGLQNIEIKGHEIRAMMYTLANTLYCDGLLILDNIAVWEEAIQEGPINE